MKKKKLKQRARALQAATGRPYRSCLEAQLKPSEKRSDQFEDLDDSPPDGPSVPDIGQVVLAAKSVADAQDVRAAVVKHLGLRDVDPAWIRSLEFRRHRGAVVTARVGSNFPYGDESNQPVVLILREPSRGLFHVCLPNRGVIRGVSVLVGTDMDPCPEYVTPRGSEPIKIERIFSVHIDTERSESAGAGGMFQVISLEEDNEDCTDLVDQGTHYESLDDLREDLGRILRLHPDAIEVDLVGTN